jgi:hypothetical protein
VAWPQPERLAKDLPALAAEFSGIQVAVVEQVPRPVKRAVSRPTAVLVEKTPF